MFKKFINTILKRSRNKPVVGMVYAQCANGGIGLKNGLPWKLRADMDLFWSLVSHSPVMVGYKTFMHIKKYLLKHECECFVVEKGSPFHDAGKTLKALHREKKVWVIGGAKTYEEALPHSHVIVATHIHESFNCDSFLPWVGTPKGFVFYDCYELKTKATEPKATVNIYVRKDCVDQADSYLEALNIPQSLFLT